MPGSGDVAVKGDGEMKGDHEFRRKVPGDGRVYLVRRADGVAVARLSEEEYRRAVRPTKEN